MKHFLLSLPVLLISLSAFAEGRSYDNGGCSAEQMDSFCSMIGFLFVALIVLVIIGSVYHNYKMKTDPAYRERDAQLMREYNERHPRRY